jgi:hypothetical protein
MTATPSVEEAVKMLDAIDGRDGEGAHAEADWVLELSVHPDVLDAYNRVVARAQFWAFA